MNHIKRIELYKKALKDYRLAKNPFRKFFKNKDWMEARHAGFCHYFYTLYKIDFRNNPLPELYNTRPYDKDNTSNWFPKGKEGLINRIHCLKHAIELCEAYGPDLDSIDLEVTKNGEDRVTEDK